MFGYFLGIHRQQTRQKGDIHMASLAEIRAKLQAQENGPSGNNGGGDNAIYPFWNMTEGSSSTLRFLPDSDENNPYFWKERLMIRLPFNGIKGQDSKQTIVQVPCMEMYGDACPILAEVRTWFKDASLEDMGRKYWKKKSYVFQGFVRENGLNEDSTPENPIRRFIIGPQIFQLIKSALMDPELEELPTDYQRGLDFRMTKTTKGGYADYSTSKWARKETALTNEELKAIESNGLHNLADFLPKKPSETELSVIKAMFEASVDGEAYDPDKFGAYFRPSGMSAPAGASSMPAPAPAPAPKAETVNNSDDDVPFESAESKSAPVVETKEEPAGESNKKAEDILAMIRSRQKS